MNSITFTLQAIDQLISCYKKDLDPRGYLLLGVLRRLYPAEQDLNSHPGFSTEQIIEEFFENERYSTISEDAFELEAAREELNRQLLRMMDENSNPAGILIGDRFAFIQLKRHKFKPSELAFRLPQILHDELQEKMRLLKIQNEEEEKRLEALKEKEAALVKRQAELEEEQANKRNAQTEQLLNLQNSMDRQRHDYEEEISRLKVELDQLRNHQATSQSDQEERLMEDIRERTQLNQVLEEHFQSLESNQKEFATLVAKLKKQESEFLKFKKGELKIIRQRERFLKKSSEAHLERIQAWDQRILETNQAETLRRRKQDKDYQNKIQELQQDFKRQLIHFQLRADEDREKALALEEERQQLLVQKQALKGEIQSRTEEYLKKRQEELAKEETTLQKNLERMNKLSGMLVRDKSQWMESIQTEEGTRFTRSELERLLQDQEKLTQGLVELTQELKTQRKEEEAALITQKLQFKKERDEFLALVSRERETLKETLVQLNKKEKFLTERETQELARLHEDYEDLRLSLEVSQIEKGERLDERDAEIHQHELDIQNRFQEYQEYTHQTRKEWAELEEKIQAELEVLFSTRLEQDAFQTEARNFFEGLKATFQKRLAVQKKDMERYRLQMHNLKVDATMIKNHLEAEAESTQANQSSKEQTLDERVRQHKEFMESLEKDLRSRIDQYRNQSQQLSESREDLQKSERQSMKTFLDNLTHYDQRLQEIGHAFEELSDTFAREQSLKGIQLEASISQESFRQQYEGFSEERAQHEWAHVLHRMSQYRGEHLPEIQTQYLEEWNEQWKQWVSLEPGEFWLGHESRKDALPLEKSRLDQPIQVSRYPITNLEFMLFVLQTGYRTEAEMGNGGIVYMSGVPEGDPQSRISSSTPTLEPMQDVAWWCPDGSPDFLAKKYNHPVTLVTWNDALAFCQWKSEQSGHKVRLPRESEWEYLACNLGQIESDLPWEMDEGLRHGNFEESGIGGTTAVDHFPEHSMTGGVLDLFGNVYEWVQDGPPPVGRSASLDYKLARGGGFLTRFQQVARWRRLAFLSTYRTSFIGFRVVEESSPLSSPVS